MYSVHMGDVFFTFFFIYCFVFNNPDKMIKQNVDMANLYIDFSDFVEVC